MSTVKVNKDALGYTTYTINDGLGINALSDFENIKGVSETQRVKTGL